MERLNVFSEADPLTKDHENPSQQKPRGLWDVMRGHPEAPSPQQATDSSSPQNSETNPQPLAEESGSASASGKGLWAMMGVAPTPASQNAPSTSPPANEGEEEEPETAAPAPAWFRGKAASEETETETKAERVDQEISGADEEEATFEPETEVAPAVEPEPTAWVVPPPQSPAVSKHVHLAKKTGRSKGALLSLAVGLLAIPLTFLAATPEIWTRIPATVVGFGALVLGLVSFNEIQRSRGLRTGKGFAMAGMVLGTVAMFLGPMVIAPWSQSQNTMGRRQVTKKNLEAMGRALREYHTQHDHYPPGGTYRVEESGETTPMHSWMTELLPFLDANAIYQEIQRDEPWNAPSNKSAFSQSIPAFLAGGVEQTRNRAGYGLSHFAGVGGQIQVNGGQMANVGIFDRSSQVTRQNITDGLSQTLIAGEIPQGYRPWGEPGNWRDIGAGLNQDTTSFGNAERTGAIFLKADGSVQFFSNRVSTEILKSLSTRDGDDNRLIPEKYR